MKKKIVLLFMATIMLIGGIMGVVKGIFPKWDCLSFRYILTGTATYENELPTYVRIYGIVMGILEILSALLIYMQKRKLILFIIIMLIINTLGCIVAICIGDTMAIVSLIIRIVLIYFFINEYKLKYES